MARRILLALLSLAGMVLLAATLTATTVAILGSTLGRYWSLPALLAGVLFIGQAAGVILTTTKAYAAGGDLSRKWWSAGLVWGLTNAGALLLMWLGLIVVWLFLVGLVAAIILPVTLTSRIVRPRSASARSEQPHDAESCYRPLTEAERSLIVRMLTDQPFPGRDELLGQCETALAKAIDGNGSLQLRCMGGTRADTRSRTPVEADATDQDGGTIRYALHVAEGMLHQLRVRKQGLAQIISHPDRRDLRISAT